MISRGARMQSTPTLPPSMFVGASYAAEPSYPVLLNVV